MLDSAELGVAQALAHWLGTAGGPLAARDWPGVPARGPAGAAAALALLAWRAWRRRVCPLS